jgi:diguanylate cyclase (GGDEF)-like protein
MLKKILEKKEYRVIGIMVTLFIFSSCLSLVSIRQIQGNARVVNFVGLVRGATQKLVKEELRGEPDNDLLTRLDSIVEELISGEGPHDLIVLRDDEYLNNMRQVKIRWIELKKEITGVRGGADSQKLYDLSQSYFDLVNETVFFAERFSEYQAKLSRANMTVVNIVFVLVLLAGIALVVRGAALRRHADMLGAIAYVDTLTQIDNRASCERAITRLKERHSDEDLAVIMFDMNNLKLANDCIGHQGGDRIIYHFARILQNEAEKYGFIGRYGGDEFIALFEKVDKNGVKKFLEDVERNTAAYNSIQVNAIEKISYAVGYSISKLTVSDINIMINDADRYMYENKRQGKKGK